MSVHYECVDICPFWTVSLDWKPHQQGTPHHSKNMTILWCISLSQGTIWHGELTIWPHITIKVGTSLSRKPRRCVYLCMPLYTPDMLDSCTSCLLIFTIAVANGYPHMHLSMEFLKIPAVIQWIQSLSYSDIGCSLTEISMTWWTWTQIFSQNTLALLYAHRTKLTVCIISHWNKFLWSWIVQPSSRVLKEFTQEII